MIPSAFPELLAICNRMVCICAGRVTGVLDRNAASRENLMHYCTQQPATEKATWNINEAEHISEVQ